MKRLKQWVNWRPEQREDGSIAKKPCPASGIGSIDSQDPKNWLNYIQAKSFSDRVGFVLTENDPYFCVDLDDSFVDGKWTDHCNNVLTWFPGAYLEVSFSGKGLHIFGTCNGKFPEHRKKSKSGESKTELYTSKRFIAFTEVGTVGDYNTDLTSQLHEFIRVILPPDGLSTLGNTSDLYGGYTTPDSEWLGPEDDTELIERMLLSKKSAASILGGKASIHDLWGGVASVLVETYPDKPGTYNRSAADAALFAHLAFWTGKDGPRMERIGRLSGLMREKWDKHPLYLSAPKYTIHNACDRCNQVYRDPKRASELQVENSDDPDYLFGSQFLSISAQVARFKGCVYILDRHRIFTPEAGVLKPDQFNAWYGGATFALSHDGKSVTKKPFEALTNSQGYKFPKVMKSCFRPEHKPGEIIKISGRPCINTYIPAIINFGTGPVDMFLFLINKLFPEKQDQDIILNYAAACVQYPGTKFRWCPVVQGMEGNGKSLIMECVGHAVGEDFTHIPQAHDLANKFNSWIAEKLLITVEEVFTVDKRETIEALKTMVTNRRIPSQGKSENTVTIDNRANFWMCTNHKNALMKTKKDRRYAIFFTPQQEAGDLQRDGLTEAFFKKFGNWLDYHGGWNDVAGFLKRHPIVEALNPATTKLTAPDTTSTQEAIQESQGVIHQEIKEAIEQGLYGFRGGWISSYALTELLESKHIAKFLPLSKRKNVLQEVGYIPMPWTSGGRASGQIPSEGNTRSVLYVKESYRYGIPLTTNDYINAQSENK